MGKLFDKHLGILRDVDMDVYGKKPSAEYFLKQAKKGTDIAAAIPSLLELYRESHQVPVMEPAADAILLYYLNHNDIKSARAFINDDEYKMFSIQSIGRLAKDGYDVAPYFPIIIKYFKSDQYQVFHVIKAYIEQTPDHYQAKLIALAQLMNNNNKSRYYLPFVVKQGAFDKMDMGVLLPYLIPLLSDSTKRLREDAAYAFRLAAEGGSDFTPVTDLLQDFIKNHKHIDYALPYGLTYTFIGREAWHTVKSFVFASRKDIRIGAYRALSVRYNNTYKNDRTVFDLLLSGLTDRTADIRSLVLQSLLQAERKDITIAPRKKDLEAFGDTLRKKGNNDEYEAYLYHIGEKNKQLADALIMILGTSAYHSNERALRLKRQLEKITTQSLHPVCSICSHIKRYGIYYSEYDLPRETKKLELSMPAYGTNYSHPRCPECGCYYYYRFEQEVEDMSVDTTITLYRMDPFETLMKLNKQHLADYEAALPGVIVKYNANLNHPVEFARAEAAWALAAFAVNNQHWDDVLTLLNNDDPVIQQNALAELARLNAADIPFTVFGDYLHRVINEALPGLMHHATGILADLFINEKKYEDLLPLITHANDHIASPATYRIWMAVRNQQFDIGPIYAQLHTLTRSPSSTVRNHCRYAIEEAPSTSPESALTMLIDNLNNPDVNVRKDAAFSLEMMAKKNQDITPAIPHLARLLSNNKTTFYALSALKNAANWTKISLIDAIPALLRIIALKKSRYHTDAAHTLFVAMQNGTDLSNAYEMFAKNILTKSKNITYSEVYIIERARDEKQDLSAIEPYLKDCLDKHKNRLTDSFGDFLTETLAYIYITGNRWHELEALLTHPVIHIPGGATSHIAQNDYDITPVLPLIVTNLIHDYWYIRGQSASTLIKYAGKNTTNKQRVIDLINNLDTGKTKKLDEVHEVMNRLGHA